MNINGQHMDDARFKTIVDILVGRTDSGIKCNIARREATKIAKRAVAEIMEWSERQAPCYSVDKDA